MTTRYTLNIDEAKITKRNSKQVARLKELNLDGKTCYYKVATKGKYWCFSDTPEGLKVPECMLTEIPAVKHPITACDNLFAGKVKPTGYPLFKAGWDACLKNEQVKLNLTKTNKEEHY